MSQIDIETIKKINDVESAIEYFRARIPTSALLEQAFLLASTAHKGQCRKSGEPYIVHPILVASIVAELTGDEAMVIAALLHDVVEDTVITIEEIGLDYGADVAHLVEGLTKIDMIRDAELIPSHSDQKLVV
ncbi:MAG: HD domain-containing protein, partial [Sulfuricurvum sp.]|nr:HD domain-containing protein [Sulfuricurvum sp.]